jgi:glycine betaine transporter
MNSTGMFIAKISKGRTIREFINGTLSAPVLYSFMWLVVFGGDNLFFSIFGGGTFREGRSFFGSEKQSICPFLGDTFAFSSVKNKFCKLGQIL